MKSLFIIGMLVGSSSVFAYGGPGNGTAGGTNGSNAEGGAGHGAAQLGYFPGWQTASPAKKEALIKALPVQPATTPEPLQFPSWVKN